MSLCGFSDDDFRRDFHPFESDHRFEDRTKLHQNYTKVLQQSPRIAINSRGRQQTHHVPVPQRAPGPHGRTHQEAGTISPKRN